MATREMQRTFDPSLGAVIVELEDDFGVHSVHTIHVVSNHELCPACGRRLQTDAGGEVDVDAVIQGLLDETDARTDKLTRKFEKHGADMSGVKARRQAHVRPSGHAN